MAGMLAATQKCAQDTVHAIRLHRPGHWTARDQHAPYQKLVTADTWQGSRHRCYNNVESQVGPYACVKVPCAPVIANRHADAY